MGLVSEGAAACRFLSKKMVRPEVSQGGGAARFSRRHVKHERNEGHKLVEYLMKKWNTQSTPGDRQFPAVPYTASLKSSILNSAGPSRSACGAEKLMEPVSNSSNWVKGDTAGEKVKFHQSIARIRALKRKAVHGRFFRLTDDTRTEERARANQKSRSWHDKAGMSPFYESAMFDIREQNLPVKSNMGAWYGSGTMCRFCGSERETVDHLTAGCKKFSFRDIKFRHDQICKRVYYFLLEKIGAPAPHLWFSASPARTLMWGGHTIQWDPFVAIVQNVGHNHPDIIWKLPDGTQRIIEVCCPCDKNVREWVEKKYKIYKLLKADFENNKGIPTEIVPIVIGNTGLITEELEDDITCHLEFPASIIPRLQRIALYETVNYIKQLLRRDPVSGGVRPRALAEGAVEEDDEIVCEVFC